MEENTKDQPVETSLAIHHGSLKRDWPMVRPGLEQIKARFDVDWIPEDIYLLIKTGRASLYVSDQAFAVLQPIIDELTHQPGVFLLVAHSDGEIPDADLIEGLNQIAKQAGYQFWEVDSQRRGWERQVSLEIRHFFTHHETLEQDSEEN